MNDLAPIGITTYTRLNHLKQTIESLQKNSLALRSDLYIFSDAPQRGDEGAVENLRSYIRNIDGFKKVNVIERASNGAKKNALDGVSLLLGSYEKMIWLEDDNVVSEFFLEFMNDALEKYKYNKTIIAISAFNIPTMGASDMQAPCFMSKLFCAWGYATWGNRDFLAIINNSTAYSDLQDWSLRRKVRRVHPGLHLGLKKISEGRLFAGDYSLVFHAIKNDMYFIKPGYSLVKNIGHDGSGLNCGVDDKFDIEAYNRRIVLDDVTELQYSPKHDHEYFRYFHGSVSSRIINKAKNLLTKMRMSIAG